MAFCAAFGVLYCTKPYPIDNILPERETKWSRWYSHREETRRRNDKTLTNIQMYINCKYACLWKPTCFISLLWYCAAFHHTAFRECLSREHNETHMVRHGPHLHLLLTTYVWGDPIPQHMLLVTPANNMHLKWVSCDQNKKPSRVSTTKP